MNKHAKLAQWLQELLALPVQSAPPERTSLLETGGHSIEDYHPAFYQQLPDFSLALLKQDEQAMLRYAPLVYHLVGCPACHSAYLDIFDAMRAAHSADVETSFVETGPHSLALTPARMLVYLCQLLIQQARVVLRQARREHTDQDAQARVLLRQAILMSAHILQDSLRQRALQHLVEVAAPALDGEDREMPGPALHSYTSLVGSAGTGSRKGISIRRRADMAEHPLSEVAIDLQCGTLEGAITQDGDTLQLALHGLDASLRGHYLLVSIPLGSLLEPVRWVGRNPRAIRSQAPVDAHGNLKTPLGSTELRLTDREDRNLLEAMFKKLDIRPVDISA